MLHTYHITVTSKSGHIVYADWFKTAGGRFSIPGAQGIAKTLTKRHGGDHWSLRRDDDGFSWSSRVAFWKTPVMDPVTHSPKDGEFIISRAEIESNTPRVKYRGNRYLHPRNRESGEYPPDVKVTDSWHDEARTYGPRHWDSKVYRSRHQLAMAELLDGITLDELREREQDAKMVDEPDEDNPAGQIDRPDEDTDRPDEDTDRPPAP